MKYLLIFAPAIIAMIWALYGEHKRKSTVGLITLFIVCACTLVRFLTLAYDFSGGESSMVNFITYASSLYIIPTMYMFLCDQCGTKWNNSQSIFMLLLPFLMLITSPVIDLGTVSDPQQHELAIAHAVNVFNDGKLVFYLMMRPTIVIIQCLIVAYCMVRLWKRINDYGLKLTRPMTIYYIWMFFMLGFMILGHARRMDMAREENTNIVFFVVWTAIITTGLVAVPSKFKVAPLVTKDEGKSVKLDSFMEQNSHLAEHLHQLFEEDRIYLQSNLHIDDVASMMGTNRTYVTRLMRQEFGQTFNDYVNNARIIYSKKLLLTSSMQLEEIAQSSGFPNSSAYCRVFKRLTDTSPMAWKTEQGE